MINRWLIGFSFLALLLVGACSEEDFGPVLTLGDAPAITAPTAGSSFVLTEDKAGEVFADFSWTAADFGFAAGVSYTLEMDRGGANFAAPVSLGAVNSLSLEVTKGKINSVLLAKGVGGGTSIPVEFRVVATVNPDVAPVYSPTISVNVTPYESVIEYPKLQVPGSYQGWDPANSNTVIHSLKSDGRFEGYLYFADPNTEFKYTDGPSWDVNYGDTGADGTLDRGGDNIKATDGGMYKLNVNINTLTHTYVKTDWGLVGSATPGGWDTDQNMTYDPATGVLSITLDLVAGEIKFRANDAWDIDLGDDDANKSLEYGGANIAIAEAGNYTVELLLNVPVYTYKITKN